MPPGDAPDRLALLPTAAAALLGAALLGSLWIASVLLIQRAAGRATGIRLSALGARIAELEARRAEKDFMLRSLNDPEFFQSGRSEFLDKQRAAVALLRQEVARLAGLVPPEEVAAARSVQEQIELYSVKFETLVEAHRRLGFLDSGLEGKLRAAFARLEEALEKSRDEALAAAGRELRGGVGELFRRRDPALAQGLVGSLERLASGRTAPGSAPLAELATLTQSALADYLHFLEVVGASEEEGIQREFRAAIRGIEPTLAALLEKAVEADVAAQGKLVAGIAAAGIVMTVLLVLTVFLGQAARARSRALLAANRTIRADMEARRQAERLAAIGQMVAGLAHESGNALQRSQACLDMLAHRVRDDGRAVELVARIQDAQNRLHHLYEEVRGYAAPVRLERRRCRLDEVLRKAWDDLALVRAGRDAALLEEPGSRPSPASADAFAMEQVFRNVLENSLAAGADPLRIEVRWSHLEGPRSLLRVSIRDNGPGLTPEARRRIFDPFFTTKTTGTGLGMAIARRLVEAHGGDIEVGTAAAPGAEIVITMPPGEEAS